MGIGEANKKITLFFPHEIPESTIRIILTQISVLDFVFYRRAANMAETKGKLGRLSFDQLAELRW